MKILFIAKQMPWDPSAWGGDEHTFQLSMNISKQYHKVIFVNNSLQYQVQSDWHPHKLPYITYRGRPFYPKTTDLRKLIDEIKPDLVHHFSTMGYYFERKLKKGESRTGLLGDHWQSPQIPSICSLWTDRVQVAGLKSKYAFLRKGKLFRFWAAYCEQFSANHADCITTTSKANAESLERNYHLQSVIAIPRGLDTEKFKSHREPNQIILVPCRLEEEKGVKEIIRIFDQLSLNYPEWRLEIAGTGPFEGFLRTLARKTKNSKKISFLGKIPHYEMPNLYSRSSVVVLNSAFEPFGAIVTEAGSCSRPVIATCHGGPSEIIDNGRTGILIDPDNSRTLRKAFLTLLQDESKARRMGEQARKHIINNYSWAAEAKAYATLYEEVVNQ